MPQPPSAHDDIRPGKPILRSYPTPDLSDRIFVVHKDARKGDYQVPEKGAAFDGPEAEKYEGYIFAKSVPSDQFGWVDHFYLNVRKNEDAYNFSIEYPWVSKDYPRVTRTYVVLREDYKAPEAHTPDTAYENLLLVDSKQTRSEDPVIDSLFVAVTNVFERIPAPTAYEVEKFESVLPYKMRVAVPQIIVTTVEEGPAQEPAVPPGTWSASEKSDSAFRKTVTSATRNLPDGGIVFIGEKLTRDKQVATVTESWKKEQQHLVPKATMVDGDVEQVGDGTTIMTTSETDDVFPERAFEVQIPDPIPAEFSDLAPVRTQGETLTAQAAPPELQPGDLRVSEQQKDEFNMRRERTGRDISKLPKTTKDYQLGGIQTHGSEFGGTLETANTLDNKPQKVEEGFDIIGSSVKSLPGGLSLRKTTRLFTGDNGTGPYLKLLDGGDSYVDDPAVVFDSDRGTGAAGTATISEVQLTPDLDAGGDFTILHVVGGPGPAENTTGIFNFLGKRYNNDTWANPITTGIVIASVHGINTPTAAQLAYVVDQDTTKSLVINPVAGGGNYLLFDFGAGREVAPNEVVIRGPSDVPTGAAEASKFEVWGFNTVGDNSDIVKLGGPFTLPAHGQWGSFTLTATKAYRYLRVNAANLTSVPGSYGTIYPAFYIPEIEFYGDLTIAPAVELNYSYNGDANGVFYYLGQRGGGGAWRNPQTAGDIAITAPYDTLEAGTFDSIVDREPSNTYLAQRDAAELWFDLGADRSLRMNTLLFRARADYGSATTVVYLQGSEDGSTWPETQRLTVDNHASSWTKINVTALTEYYRYFRLILAADKDWLMLGEVEFYGLLRIAPAEVGTNVSVTGVNITTGGTNYATAPLVEFSGGEGSGAAATAVVEDGVVVAVNITSPGTGYTAAPDVAFVVPGQGSGATAAATLSGATVASIAVVDGGAGYTEAPVVKIVSATGSGAAAHAVLTDDEVTSIVVDTPGSGYALPPTVVLYPATDPEGEAEIGFDVDDIIITNRGANYTSPPSVHISGSGAEASATVELGFGIDSVQLTSGGDGYTSAPTVGIVGNGTGATATARIGKSAASAAVTAGGSGYLTEPEVKAGSGAAQFRAVIGRPILTIGLTAKGSGYTSDPTVGITGDGSSAAAHVVRSFAIASIAVSAGGSGYTTPPTVVIPAPTGNYPVQATAHAVLTAGVVTSIVIDNPGSGYLTAPTATLTGGDGTGATAGAVTLESGGAIDSIVIDNHGAGYTTAMISFSGGGGSGAAATTGLDTSVAGAIKAIEVTNAGYDYETAPTLTIVPGTSGGTGATATASLASAGRVIAIDVTAAGELYSGTVTLTFTGGGGSGAAGTVVKQAAGKLKSITLIAGGSGFRDDTVIDFIGGGGSGAAATATRGACGKVVQVRLTKPGGPFVTPPPVRFVGGQSNLCPGGGNSSWRLTSPMVIGRSTNDGGGHPSAKLDDGRVLVAGCSNDTGFPSIYATVKCEIYDPATGTWSPTGDLAVPRTSHVAIKLQNGKVLVLGGNGVATFSPVYTCELYNPATGTWSGTGSMLSGGSTAGSGAAYDPDFTGFYTHAVLLNDGRVLALTGFRNTLDTQIYDPSTGTWSAASHLAYEDSMVFGWINSNLTLLPNGNVLATYGRTNVAGAVKYGVYNTALNSWTYGNVPGYNDYLQSAVLLDSGLVFVSKGFDALSGAALYDYSTDTWTILPADTTAYRWGRCGIKLLDGRVMLAGGSGTTPTNYTIFDPSDNSYFVGPSGSVSIKHDHSFAELLDNGSYLLMGGVDAGSAKTPVCEIFGSIPTPATAEYKLGSSWPTLTEIVTDPTEGIRTALVKSIVPKDSAVPDGFVDVFPLDIYRSIQIVSKVDLTSLPKPTSWHTSQNVSFPSQLLAVYPIWDQSTSQSTSGGGDTGTNRGQVGASVEVHGAIVVTKRSGFRGAALGRIDRQFFASLAEAEAANVIVEPTIIQPSSGTAILHTTGASSDLQGLTYNQSPPLNAMGQPAKIGDPMPGGGTYAGYFPAATKATSSGTDKSLTQAVDLPDVLTPGVNSVFNFSANHSSSADVLTTSVTATGKFTVVLPASTPTIIVPGKAVLAQVVLEKWRFGIYVRHLIYLAAPIG
jgi:hypothetical protein